MDDLLLVDVFERVAHLTDEPDHVVERQARIAVAFEQQVEIRARHEVHHEEVPVGLDEVVGDPDHSRVAQELDQPCLGLEPRRLPRVQQPLERHVPPGLVVVRPIYLTHGPARQRSDDGVPAPDRGAAGKWRMGVHDSDPRSYLPTKRSADALDLVAALAAGRLHRHRVACPRSDERARDRRLGR